jgi:hypothetical protein
MSYGASFAEPFRQIGIYTGTLAVFGRAVRESR